MDLGSALKKTIPNPNRSSRQYTRQSAFVGSDREIRGKIIRTLLLTPGQEIDDLIRTIGDDGSGYRESSGPLKKKDF